MQDDVDAFAVCIGLGCADGIPKAFFLTLAFADNIRDVVGFFRLLRKRPVTALWSEGR